MLKNMKTLRQLKKRTLMSMLFLGVSLAAFAFAPQVWILSWSVTNITSNSAHLVVEHEGAKQFKLEILTLDGECVGGISKYTDSINPEDIIYSVMDIVNLQPSTTYRLKITVTGFPDETGQSDDDVENIYFTTASEVQP